MVVEPRIPCRQAWGVSRWVYGFLIFGVALIHSLIIKETEAHQLKHGMKRCPHCAELVKRKAHVCRYCGKELDK